jgi:hypothetical protein
VLTRHPRRLAADALTAAQLQELWLGPNPAGSFFRSEREARETWNRHRDFLMEQYGSHGRRPLAWWVFEAGDLRHPGYDLERSTLFQACLLTEAERAELLTYWREQFDRANAPDFSYRDGSGKLLEGEAARRAHYRGADIPPMLVAVWSAERPSDA